MAEFIRVRNWEKFQHYKDRSAPWIKLYRDMMDSALWVMSSDASKLLAMCTMFLAVRNDNKIPLDIPYIRRVCHLETDPDFSDLIKHQFIEIIDENGDCYQHASNLLAMCTTEKRRIEERREEKASAASDKSLSAKDRKISFDYSLGQWDGIEDKDARGWELAYPALDVETELFKAAEWVKANPANRKSNWRRFLTNWFSRAQERAPRRP